MESMSATVHFSIKYDGPALSDHQMDVRDLAPALIALSTLLEEANRAAYPNSPEVRVSVNGNFRSGSFGVDLTAVQSIAQQIVTLLAGQESTAIANLLALLGGIGLVGAAGKGLIGLLKWLKGRKPTTIRLQGETAVFELQMSETVETFEVDLVAGRLYQSRVVRQALAKVVKPLETDGIDFFACGKGGQTETAITKDEVSFFLAAADDAEVVSEARLEGVLLQIESAVFKDGNKWRFHDGSSPFFAEIEDADFIARVEAGTERFGKGDVLVVDLRRVQSITDTGLKVESTVEKVIEHRAPLQPPLI